MLLLGVRRGRRLGDRCHHLRCWRRQTQPIASIRWLAVAPAAGLPSVGDLTRGLAQDLSLLDRIVESNWAA